MIMQNKDKMQVYEREKLLVLVFNDFLTKTEVEFLYDNLENTAPWKMRNRRTTLTYGDKGVSYKYKLYGKEIHRIAIPWTQDLFDIKERIRKITSNDYNYVVAQRYPNGKSGINPHRDKEMKRGTDICGVSLGTKRTFLLTPPKWIKEESIEIPLPPGSLYILKSPTNDYWSHSIVKDDSTEPRISLTYRFTDILEKL